MAGSIKLNARALEAYRAHLVRRAKIDQRIDNLLDKLDDESERIILEIMDHMDLAEDENWILDGRFHDEFGVVLLRAGPAFDDGEDGDEAAEERPVPN